MTQLVFLFLGVAFLLSEVRVLAAPVVVSEGPVTFDWGRHVLRYSGYSEAEEKPSSNFVDLERNAFVKGMTSVRGLLAVSYQSFLEELGLLSQELKEGEVEQKKLSPQYERYSFIVSREFFSNHGLSVAIRSPLSRLFVLSEDLFEKKVAAEAVPEEKQPFYSGVVLGLNQATQPKAVYRIVDEDHNLLFSYRDLTYASYGESLMGRWYSNPSSREIRAVVGTNPIRLKLNVLESGLYQFDSRESSLGKEKLQDLLARGKIMLEIEEKTQ